MIRILLATAAVLAVMVFGGRPAQAYGDAPWCAVYTMGFGGVHWECEYNSIEACRPTILAGNRGFCNPNPYYHAPVERHVPRHHHRRRH
jgi:Protein of unknown function (DUF3551)